MDIDEFKLTKNRQRPDMCYSYTMIYETRKYTIFTLNEGKSFLATVEEMRSDGRYFSTYRKNHNSVEECLKGFEIINIITN